MGFSREEYWSGLPRASPGDFPDPGTEPTPPASPALQADSLPLSHKGSPHSWIFKQYVWKRGIKYTVILPLISSLRLWFPHTWFFVLLLTLQSPCLASSETNPIDLVTSYLKSPIHYYFLFYSFLIKALILSCRTLWWSGTLIKLTVLSSFCTLPLLSQPAKTLLPQRPWTWCLICIYVFPPPSYPQLSLWLTLPFSSLLSVSSSERLFLHSLHRKHLLLPPAWVLFGLLPGTQQTPLTVYLCRFDDWSSSVSTTRI